MASEYVIETRQLCKRHGSKVAIDALDLRLDPGCIHAVVGANGAGKSTLFRILLGFLPATSGDAWILGRDCRDLMPADRARIGFVNEEHTLPGWMTIEAVTTMQRRQYDAWSQPVYDDVIGHYNMRPRQKIAELSRGERAGFNLALALAQSPELLVLDEPTLGLDVVAKRAFLDALLYSNAAEGRTVIYCSHQMEEVERVADNLVIMERGALRSMCPPDDFRERVVLWLADIPFSSPDPRTVPGLLDEQRIDGIQHYLVIDQGEAFADFLGSCGARDIHRMPVSLDRAINGFLAKGHAAPTREMDHA